jgi:hypothetical protein
VICKGGVFIRGVRSKPNGMTQNWYNPQGGCGGEVGSVGGGGGM